MNLLQLETNLETIAAKGLLKEKENDRFVKCLKNMNSDALDKNVADLNKKIEQQVDCTTCGNCCKTLMINVEEHEADNVTHFLQIKRKDFDEKYIEKSESGKMIINAIPCHFLSKNVCSIYEARFAGCKEFPALHLPHFQKRLFTVFMHYSRCPIIFNVIEELKDVVGFD